MFSLTTIKECEKALKENGFWEKRRAKHGALWTDGYSNLQVAGTPGDWRSYHNFKKQLKQALLKREQIKAATEEPKPMAKLTLGDAFPKKHAPTPEVVVKPKVNILPPRWTPPVKEIKDAGYSNSFPKPDTLKNVSGGETKPMAAPLSEVAKIAQDASATQGVGKGAPQAKETAPAPKGRTKGWKKFTAEERALIWGRIKHLIGKGLTPSLVAIQLRNEGVTMPDGSTVVTNYINKVLINAKAGSKLYDKVAPVSEPIGKMRAAPIREDVVPPKREEAEDNAETLRELRAELERVRAEVNAKKEILAAPVKPEPPIVPAPKVEQIATPPVQAVAARKTRMPDACVNILTDPELSDSQKVRMLLAWMEL